GCRALLDGFITRRWGLKLTLHPDDPVGCQLVIGHVAYEFGEDPAGVDREGPDPLFAAPPVEFDGEQRVRRLRLPVGRPLVVSPPLEVRVVQINRGAAVSDGRQGNNPRGPRPPQGLPEPPRDPAVS